MYAFRMLQMKIKTRQDWNWSIGHGMTVWQGVYINIKSTNI